MSTAFGGICPTCHLGAGLHGGHCPNGGKPEAEWTTHEQREAERRRRDPRVRAALEELRAEVEAMHKEAVEGAMTWDSDVWAGRYAALARVLFAIDRRLA